MSADIFLRYYKQSPEQVIALLQTSVDKGLTDAQVDERQRTYGLNQVKEHEATWYSILIGQSKSPILYLFVAIAILSFIVDEKSNAFIIMLCVLVNIGFGFYQEYRAQENVRNLKRHLVSYEQVMRDGKRSMVPVMELVPGDIVYLYPGDIVPADLRIVQEEGLMIDESMLTGESEPVKKVMNMPAEQAPDTIFEAYTICFAGTTVVRGTAIGVVIATAAQTVMGAIAYRTVTSLGESSFAKSVKRLSLFIFLLVIVMLVIVFLVNLLLKGVSVFSLDLLLFCTALVISVVPEALPVVITFCLSQGVRRLARHEIIVRRLAAIETLGSITMLCVDKTGTLTENKLTVAASNPVHDRRVLFYAALASETYVEKIANTAKGFDIALLAALTAQEKEQLNRYRRVKEIPFDPNRRDNRLIVESEGHCEIIVRGMAEGVMPLCANLTPSQQKTMYDWIDAQELQGNRVLAVAGKKLSTVCGDITTLENSKSLELIGCVSFTDPLKPTAAHALAQAHELGVSVKIISGDSKRVCGAVAKELGLITDADHVLLGSEFGALTQEEQEQAVARYNVFARVLPDQKYQIIQLLQKKYEVGYVGDGINDVPALKLADVALVVPDAADVARSIADFILLHKSLRVIIEGIYEGRVIRVNTLKYIKTTIASNFGNFYALSIASLFIDYLPMQPIQLLLLNLLTDFPLIAIATDTVDRQEIQRPSAYNMRAIFVFSSVMGLVSTLFDFICFGMFKRFGKAVLHTAWFVCGALTEFVCIISLRTSKLWFRARMPSRLLLLLLGIGVAITLLLPYSTLGQQWLLMVRLPASNMAYIAAIVLGYFTVNELVKLLYYRLTNQNSL